MQLFSKKLVTSEYPDSLREDLRRATICRFLVAYVSKAGLATLGPSLTNALQHHDSFGIASISCSCGFEPLLDLQNSLSDLRLKYFMDPREEKEEEPEDLVLLHSKLVYLYLEAENTSIVYIGSHNWTGPALGPRGLRNAEASTRFEFPFLPEHLEGTGSSLPSLANQHLREAWSLPVCLPATESNRHKFEGWYAKGCRRQPPSPLEDSIVVLAVHKNHAPVPKPADWQDLEGRGIYLQALVEKEGHLVWRSNNRIFVFVWNSTADLERGFPPLILRCRVSTMNAGPHSAERGTNRSNSPISGFRAVIWDPHQSSALADEEHAPCSTVSIWSGRQVEVFDFEFPLHRADSSDAYDHIRPNYQFHLEVEHIAYPAEGKKPANPSLVWEPESFGLAAKKEDAQAQKSIGFYVDPEENEEMRSCYTQIFGVNLKKAKVLPYSLSDDYKVGKRLARHPLHETFAGMKRNFTSEEFYSKSLPGATVPNLQAISDVILPEEPIRRVQKVFSSPWKRLVSEWSELSRAYSRQRG